MVQSAVEEWVKRVFSSPAEISSNLKKLPKEDLY